MVGRQHDQHVLQPDALIHIGEKVRERAVQAQQVVFGFQAGRPEEVPDVVCRGKADGQVICDFMLTELLRVDQRLREIKREVITGGTQG